MKRYLVFMFETYYPAGGCSDLIGYADNCEEIEALIRNAHKEDNCLEYVNIFDIHKGMVVPNKNIMASYEVYPWDEVKDYILRYNPEFKKSDYTLEYIKNNMTDNNESIRINNTRSEISEVILNRLLRLINHYN